nr:RecQ family ATP-dependent DNA helicase [Bacteroidales bacterium]
MPGISDYINAFRTGLFSNKKQLSGLAFIDVEVGIDDKKVHDFGAVRDSGQELHTTSKNDFSSFISDAEYLCGHNIIHHDLTYLADIKGVKDKKVIDTLFLSPLLFPKRPYHRLLKDDKLQTEERNNPLNDCLKARDLFYDEVNAFKAMPDEMQRIYFGLLHHVKDFAAFFDYLKFDEADGQLESLIYQTFYRKICSHSPISMLIKEHPVELAYALALISTGDSYSITPPWLLHNYPNIENVLQFLCNTPCHDGNCEYCETKLNIHTGLKDVFGFESFRTHDGEPLQEKAVQAAVDGKSLLAIFPTGGGKSLTFQLPALMSGRAVHGLTVVISPLQSLMKDQVDNLAEQGIAEAVTVNGLLDPVNRANAFERIADGSATLLYIAPEMLRSKTMEKLLVSRNVVRFVIDEAHCFSAWGQDFRVDYLYIGDFIRKLQEKKGLSTPIPISCFTATAKQKVITDISDYFKRKLGQELELFASPSARKNLHYSVIYAESEQDKYNTLRNLVIGNSCPTIIYVSRTRKTRELAAKLKSDGIDALPFNGKMDANEKIANQNAFIANRVKVMVATSAFGMGVDKKDVGMVIHYDISDSLENYVQEAGRAGRDPKTAAKCYVLYNDNDLDKHFILLNQTKISISEIQQVWSAIKYFTKQR